MLAPDLAEWNQWLEYWRLLAQMRGSGPSPPPDDLAQAPPEFNALIQRYSQRAKALVDGYLVDGAPAALATPKPGDRRFRAREWREYPYFDFLKQNYLLCSEFCREWADLFPSGSEEQSRARFWLERMVDSMSPSNFLATNPEALREAVASNGESVRRGLDNLMRDIARGRISMSDENAFAVGDNLATTPEKLSFATN